MNDIKRDRPLISGYGIPEVEEGMLDWSWVVDQIKGKRNYWIASTRPDGRPHATPVWGIWLDDTFHFGGSLDVRRSRNIASNPYVVMHLESGDEVVIIEGSVERVDHDDALMKRLDAEYVKKYNIEHGPPIWALRPNRAFAWAEYPTAVTRFRFLTNK